MRQLRALLAHDLTGPLIRYGISGGFVGLVYLSLPLLLHDVVGLPLEGAIPIAYAVAITLQFNLQRHFVFRHLDEFELTTRQQIARYGVLAGVQYPTTAIATAVLPGVLHISSDATYLIVAASVAVIVFLVLRSHVFHPTIEEELRMESQAEHDASLAGPRAPERELTGADGVRS